MFPSNEFWKGAMFGVVIGGIITVMLELWGKKEDSGKKSNKQPTEHDERY